MLMLVWFSPHWVVGGGWVSYPTSAAHSALMFTLQASTQSSQSDQGDFGWSNCIFINWWLKPQILPKKSIFGPNKHFN